MQAVLLAAGMGRRLRNYTEDNTKCMVKVNGKRIVDSLIESLLLANVSKLIIVTGYEGEKLKKYLLEKYKDVSLKMVFLDNPDYSTTNNIYSLWLARNYLKEDDTVLLESDILYDVNLIKDLLEDKREDLVVIDKFSHFMDGTMILLDEQERVVTFVPKTEFRYDQAHEYYKTVNIYKFSQKFLNTYYLPFLDAYLKAYGHNEYYEQVLRVLSFLPNTGLKGFKMSGRRWYEIDNAQDLDIASQVFSDSNNQAIDLSRRYGGYWRFSEILDYCYLVNPYFPTKQIVDEMKYMFDSLLRNYPSGLDVQNLLSSEVFSCRQEYILTGNGAAELIKAVLEVFEGKIGMVFPSFNEYSERVMGELVSFFPEDQENFLYGETEIIKWEEKIDVFVLINPDNPTGNYIGKKSLINIIEHYKKKGKKIIIDESFLDFAEQEDTNGLIKDEILEKYKNLIVIKSISKSYGVPGLRLGVLACSDEVLLKVIRRKMSIWNINSFGEFFLQIYPKHAKKYQDSCVKIASERDWFYDELSKISYLRTIPSKANYITCEVLGRSSNSLQTELLSNFSVFIKDLNGKKGFPKDKDYIRIAVRNREDNLHLLNALSMIGKK